MTLRFLMSGVLLFCFAICPRVAHPECSEDEIIVNHDYSFETGYCSAQFGLEGVQPPYDGAFAEAFDLGAGRIECGSFWVSQIGYVYNVPNDIYVWDGGVSGEPGEVLGLVPGIIWECPGFWPDYRRTDVPLAVDVVSEFAVGCWQQHFDGFCNEYICVDLDGPGGHPWTHIAPGLQWPSGWQDPSVPFDPTRSMAIGVQFTRDPASVEDAPDGGDHHRSFTWGRIKALF